MTLQLVTFEQAKALKDAGFEVPCTEMYFYDLDNPTEQSDPKNWVEDTGHSMNWNGYNTNGEIYASRPTVALALKWLRDVKGIHIYCEFRRNDMMWFGKVIKIVSMDFDCTLGCINHDLAESAGLDKALKMITT